MTGSKLVFFFPSANIKRPNFLDYGGHNSISLLVRAKLCSIITENVTSFKS